jgi:hypothetical protein
MKKLLPLALTAALGIAGCFGTETGNPSIAALSIDTHSSDPASVSVRAASGAIVVDQAWITFGAVALLPDGACPSGAGALAGAVLGAGDHSEPGPLSFDIALEGTASFCGLVAPFAPLDGALPAGAPPELAGRAVVLLAHLEDGTAVRIVSSFEGDVVVSDAGGAAFALEEDAAGLLVGLDVARWLGGVDLAGAAREVDGSIVLDDTRNTALRDAIDARIPQGVELYRDEGADGVLDPVPVLLGRGST